MFLVGDPVQITPKGKDAQKFWAFVDGWTGKVGGINNGAVEVVCQRDDGTKTFFVQPENLTKLSNLGRA